MRINLTPEEAVTLERILMQIGGDPEKSSRKHSESALNKVSAAINARRARYKITYTVDALYSVFPTEGLIGADASQIHNVPTEQRSATSLYFHAKKD